MVPAQQDFNGVSGNFTPKAALGLGEDVAAPGEGPAAQPVPEAALAGVAASTNMRNWVLLTQIKTGKGILQT